MRRIAIATIVLISLTCLAAPAPDSATAWAKLQKLEGTWVGTYGGKEGTSTFRVISGGSVLMEALPADSMVTMYHLDKDRLMMTHYCGAKNQPRMTGQMSEDGKSIVFDFLDITNLADPEAGHMRKLVLTFEDDDHISEQWTFRQKGKDMVETFHYARKK